jgi:hypothetical protein
MDSWEYVVEDVVVPLRTDRHDLAAALNGYATTGWELVALSGLGGSPPGSIGYRAVFKRPSHAHSGVISPTPLITAG